MLIDEVITSENLMREWPGEASREEVLREFLSAFVVRSQNVWDYCQTQMTGRGNNPEDFPNVAPSMPRMWFEWAAQTRKIVNPTTGEFRRGGLKMGVLCAAFDGDPADAGTRWQVSGIVFIRIMESGQVPHLLGRIDWRVGPGGELLSSESDGVFSYVLRPPYMAQRDDMAETLAAAAQICWMTLSFMHCKNVRIAKSPPIPERLKAARKRRGKPPLLRHHTVVIDPARSVAQAGASGSGSDASALHICRGHFKDFNECGLFGKHKGTYWWPMHARGAAERGVVSKDYTVRRGEP